MSKANLLGPWVRRFLLEYLVSELNLARNTQRSYRDTLGLLLPFVARHARKEIDEISVTDVSPDAIKRPSGRSTRIRSSRFVLPSTSPIMLSTSLRSALPARRFSMIARGASTNWAKLRALP